MARSPVPLSIPWRYPVSKAPGLTGAFRLADVLTKRFPERTDAA